MLSENQLNWMAERVSGRLTEVNNKFLEVIGNRIKDIGKMSASDAHKLMQMRSYGSDIDVLTKAISDISGKNTADIYAIYKTVAKDNFEFDKKFLAYKGLSTSFEDNKALQSLIKSYAKSSVTDYLGLTQTTAFTVLNADGNKVLTELSSAYQKVVEEAVMAVSTGQTDYQSAMRQTLRGLADSGLRTTDTGKVVEYYATGYSRRLDTAVRQNLLWGVKQANLGYQEQLGGQFGADGYEIDYHSNPRPSHADIGGKQYAIGEAKTVDGIYYPCFEDEAEQLMADYGCLHFKWPIILGVSEPNYSKQELSDLKAKDNEKFEFEGKKYTKYQASQVQRQLETAMRHQKDRANIAKAAGDDTLRRDAQGKIDMLASKYKHFSEAAGLPTKVERMRAAGFHRVKTQAQLKPMFTNGGNGGIIKSVKEADNSSKALLRIPQIPSSTITKKIESGEYSTKLSVQQYNKHIEGTAAYNAYKATRLAKGGNPQSVLSISQEEVQKIICSKAGTGIIRCTKTGVPLAKENITCDSYIGYYYGNGSYCITKKATIHYGKKNSHIVPIRGDDYD